MESVPPPTETPRRVIGRRKVFAIVVAIGVAIAGFAAWQILRPRTIAEVLAMEHLRPGTEITVQGRITAIGREDTTYGPRVYLQLDANTFCAGSDPWVGNVLADPTGSYALGESYQTSVHLQPFSFHGGPAVWAPELACPFPALHRSIGVVFDEISKVREIVLAYNGTAAGGWSVYDLTVLNATGFSPDALPVDLLKALPVGISGAIDSANGWKQAEALFYLTTSAALGPEAPGFAIADRMTSLAAPASDNGTLRFLDADSNGIVDSGDRLELLLPPTGAPNAWDTYLIRIGNWSASAPGSGAAVHIVLVGFKGPLEPFASSSRISLVAP